MNYDPYKKYAVKQRRIAVCLSGYARQFQECLPSFLKHLVKNQEVDVFIHSWDMQDYYLRTAEPQKLDQDAYISSFNPKSYLIEERPTFPLSAAMLHCIREPRDCEGMMSMFYSIFKANQLKRIYEETNNFTYDVVIRTRPDVLYKSDLDIPLNMKKEKIYIPVFGDFGGLNDQIAFGSSQVINKYCDTFNRVEELLNYKAWMNPEVLTRTNLEILRIGVNRINLDYSLMRNDGSLQNNFERQFGKRIR